jgi:tRNA 2-thiouridine synthesizing protein E
MSMQAGNNKIEVDAEGFLKDRSQWNEEFAHNAAYRDGIQLTDTHIGLVRYFRSYYDENLQHPSMNNLIDTLGSFKGETYQEKKEYQDFLYELFPHPLNPVAELCKLSGLPKPTEDVY